MSEEPEKIKNPAYGLIKKFGVAGFLFFLIKGLLWLIVPALLTYLGYSNWQ